MENSELLRCVLEANEAPVVICNLEHTVVYMNPASVRRYHVDITGRSIKDCHNAESSEKIDRVVAWFKESPRNNKVHTDFNEKENKDVYMVALRDGGELVGYYEKHEYRTRDTSGFYLMDE